MIRRGKLTEIKETNMNVDSLLLNMGVGNITKVTWDDKKKTCCSKKRDRLCTSGS